MAETIDVLHEIRVAHLAVTHRVQNNQSRVLRIFGESSPHTMQARRAGGREVHKVRAVHQELPIESQIPGGIGYEICISIKEIRGRVDVEGLHIGVSVLNKGGCNKLVEKPLVPATQDDHSVVYSHRALKFWRADPYFWAILFYRYLHFHTPLPLM